MRCVRIFDSPLLYDCRQIRIELDFLFHAGFLTKTVVIGVIQVETERGAVHRIVLISYFIRNKLLLAALQFLPSVKLGCHLVIITEPSNAGAAPGPMVHRNVDPLDLPSFSENSAIAVFAIPIV